MDWNGKSRSLSITVLLTAAACGGGDDGPPETARPDTTPPVITLIGDDPQFIEAGTAYIELGATASDNVDGDLTNSIVVDVSSVDTSVPGDYTVAYEVRDAAGNVATATRTVAVQDTIPPVITLLGDNPQVIVVGNPYAELGATATDNLDNDLSEMIVVDTSGINMSVSGNYQVLYRVSDKAGNVVSAVRALRLAVGGGWITAGSTANNRYVHDATLLQDGRVLIVGGIFPSGPAELYDPATETFTEVAAPDGVSFSPSASVTALSDGRALIVGDSSTDGAAWILDSSTDMVSPIGVLYVPREVGSDTLLADGRVLLAAGREDRGPGEPDITLVDSEIFDPFLGEITTTGSMNEPRADQSATRLPDGTVLLAGGYRLFGEFGSLTELTSAEIFDPAIDEFRSTDSIVGAGRVAHTATLLPNGSVLIVGGERNIGEPSAMYDYITGNSEFASPLITPRAGHTAVALRSAPGCSGPVLIAGGFVPGGEREFEATDSVEMYDTVLEQFYIAENLPGSLEAPVGTLLQDGRVLVTGAGEAWLFEPLGECL